MVFTNYTLSAEACNKYPDFQAAYKLQGYMCIDTLDELILNGTEESNYITSFHVVVDYCDQYYLDKYYPDEKLQCKSKTEINDVLSAI